MLKGDLATTPLAPLLLQLATDEVTGCLHVSDPAGDEALIYFKSGLVYAVSVPGRRPQLGAKLISSGALAPEALADALDAQRTELQGWRLGELLVHLGYVDQPVVEAFVKEQVHDAVWDLIRWTDGRWKFRKNEKTREDVAPPIPVADLFDNLRERGIQWEAISALVHGPTAVPVLSARGGGAPETTLDSDAWSMLCKIDGERSVAELARDCGYTMFEAGRVLLTLVQAGLVDIEEDVEVTAAPTPAPAPAAEAPADVDDGLYGATSVSSALAAEAQAATADDTAEEDGVAALARLVTEVAAGLREEEAAPAAMPEQPSHAPLQPMDDQSFAASLARVSSALADVLGPAQETADPFEVPAELRIRRAPKVVAPEPVSPDDQRRRRVREAAAAELAAAHALAEALRAAQAEEPAASARESVADVVDLAVVRREAEAAAKIEAERQAAQHERRAAEEEAARAAAEEEAARTEAERAAAEEAARVAAEEEAARVAAEEEAARVEAERLAAEEAARAEAQRLAAEEAARVAAEQEAARAEAERAAAEEAARVAAEEAARVAAEQEAARAEAERLAAEEAARIEAERLAAEEAARAAAEQEAARAEAERLAAEEAARIAAEQEAARADAEQEAARAEAERLAAEEAARVAAEQEAARAEAERLAAEEAARVAAEHEAARAEAERLAVEEAARRDAEHADAERLAAEEAARREAERADAEDEAWAEYWQRKAVASEQKTRQEAEANALLAELNAQSVEVAVPEQPLDTVVEDVEEPEPPVSREPATVGARPAMNEMADTAALLRELSSLGLDDDPPPAPAPARPPAPYRPSPAAAEPKKKKRGLFGR